MTLNAKFIDPSQPPEDDLDSEQEASEYQDNVALASPRQVAHITKAVNEDGTFKTVIKASRSDFVSKMLYLNGKPFSFEGRDYLLPVYNRPHRNILLKTSRQVEKSTFLGNFLAINSSIRPYNKSLYVAPSHSQTRQFSNEKLKPSIENSPLIKKYLQDSFVSTQVFEKSFTNGSIIFLRSAFRTADRCVAKGELIYLEDGTSVPVEKLKPGLTGISYDGTNAVHNVVKEVVSNGIKDTGVLTLQCGMSARTSWNHPFPTQDGDKRLDEITDNDFIAVPFDYLVKSKPLTDGAPKEIFAELLGLVLSDGSFARKGIVFYNKNKNLIDHFIDCLKTLDNGAENYNFYQITRPGKTTEYSVAVRKASRFFEYIKGLGILQEHQFTKFIPDKYFSSKRELTAILRGLFEGDGWVSYSKGPKGGPKFAEIGFVSGSEKLTNDVLRALFALGVMATKAITLPKLNPTKVGAPKSIFYTIRIKQCAAIMRFKSTIGFICKQQKLEGLCSLIEQFVPDRKYYDHSVPAPAAIMSAALCKEIRPKDFEFKKDYQTLYLLKNQHTVPASYVSMIYRITRDPSLLKFITRNVVWVPVKTVTKSDPIETFDIEMQNHSQPYFTVNGMISHNTRGISARDLAIDELQDFTGSEIPVILECTSHFDDATLTMAGTPKSFDNPIEQYWQDSTQNEWIVKCHHCNHFNFLDESNIAPTEFYKLGKLPPGPVCSKCFKPIDVVKYGKWMTFSPGKRTHGYRIAQIMVPWIISTMDQWERLLWKRDNYPLGQFYNEVLGLSYDNASKPITRSELVALCNPEWRLWSDKPNAHDIEQSKQYLICGGVDWGEGNDGSEKLPTGRLKNASYTILTLGAFIDQKTFRVFFVKKYTGAEVDPGYVVNDVAGICRMYGVRLLGVDWGHGWGVNNSLVRILGANRVVQFQYLPKQKEKIKWDPIGFKYQVMRNLIVSEMFHSLKSLELQFPAWSQMEVFFKDILAVFVEYIEYRREMKYDHRQSDPDDFLHSLIYARMAAAIDLGKRI